MKRGIKKCTFRQKRSFNSYDLLFGLSDSTKGGEICLNKVKKNFSGTYDIFPSKNSLKIYKKYKVSKTVY